MLYQLCLAQDRLGDATQILNQYSEALAREHFSPQEIHEALEDFPKGKSAQSWVIEA